ncbi:hypothetical protein [Spirosoma pulveris]
MTKRYYINTHGNDDRAHLFAIQYAQQLTGELGGKSIVLIVPKKDMDGWHRRLFQPETVEKLWKGVVSNGILTRLVTLKDYVKGYTDRSNDIVIAHGLDSTGELDKLSVFNNKAVVWVPWMEEDRDWVKIWKAIELKDGEELTAFELPDPVVCIALDELNNRIDKTASSFHPSEENSIKLFGSILDTKSILIDDQIKTYLLREKQWPVALVDKLLKLIRKKVPLKDQARTVGETEARWAKKLTDRAGL